jgi:cell fate regulator YaaT (PSP1 superfamily)
MFQSTAARPIAVGDYVLTDADRGIDLGRVIAVKARLPPRAPKITKMILRHASASEVEQLAEKREREARAMQIGTEKVAESGLPMVLTGAEFQFDGKKLTFYFSATNYVDFRVLVRSLFRVFGTRIWMVWNEEHAGDAKPQ